ncbi:hypothetical protein SAMN06297144_1577 [Sphingomonas guangdongensis]|uniref:DUF4440 domain-containing protein n=1 Tax=Sphingomonas guangdongensis TaxID=1141890 RepID=A0A285R299_9SPHN|nr:hypothetical protein [Sphingomonas guangdongensis]SOB86472.1 hypothetical protein SAMN06297144_1577 [Sphingomonas guangdongensis]
MISWVAPLLLLAAGPTGQAPAQVTSRSPIDRDAAAAVAVVRRYRALLAGHDEARAQRLWEPQARVAPRERRLTRFGAFTVGTPSRVEPGAGQRYVTVPIIVKSKLRDGTATRRGAVVLHRVAAEIDGATPAQKRWRIREVRIGD